MPTLLITPSDFINAFDNITYDPEPILVSESSNLTLFGPDQLNIIDSTGVSDTLTYDPEPVILSENVVMAIVSFDTLNTNDTTIVTDSLTYDPERVFTNEDVTIVVFTPTFQVSDSVSTADSLSMFGGDIADVDDSSEVTDFPFYYDDLIYIQESVFLVTAFIFSVSDSTVMFDVPWFPVELVIVSDTPRIKFVRIRVYAVQLGWKQAAYTILQA